MLEEKSKRNQLLSDSVAIKYLRVQENAEDDRTVLLIHTFYPFGINVSYLYSGYTWNRLIWDLVDLAEINL